LKIEKISNAMPLNVQGQGCNDDCTEHDKLVGKKDKNTSGCVIYSTIYTAKGNILF